MIWDCIWIGGGILAGSILLGIIVGQLMKDRRR